MIVLCILTLSPTNSSAIVLMVVNGLSFSTLKYNVIFLKTVPYHVQPSAMTAARIAFTIPSNAGCVVMTPLLLLLDHS